MQSQKEYLRTLRTEYLKTTTKKTKGRLLDEAVKRTGLERKWLIKILRPKSNLDVEPTQRKKRCRVYNKECAAVLARLWEIFDYACGTRLKSAIVSELARLCSLGEITCSLETGAKLLSVSPRTIDTLLAKEKVERLRKQKYEKKIHPLLYQQIPVKVFNEQNRSGLGNIQLDLVEHCGASAQGEYVNTLSTTDIATGWWEGEAVLGKPQERTKEGVERVRNRYPFTWQEIHTDNGQPFINSHLFSYAYETGLRFSRSRPYKKNDNCCVEQKNRTHVKRFVGYLRYDTKAEQTILNELYRDELRLYKNFFQPVMKLVKKERLNGRIHRVYDRPLTPYERVMRMKGVPRKIKTELKRIHDSLNPALLKRRIDRRLDELYETYKSKQAEPRIREEQDKRSRKTKKISVSFFTANQKRVSVS